jgi:hypothetical protein
LPEGSGLTESVERSARRRAWRGDREALRRLCGVVQAFATRQLEKELSRAPNMPSVVRAREISEDYARERQEQEEQSARLRWRVTARASEVEYNRSRSGTPDEVIDALDERAVDTFSVDLRMWAANDSITVEVGLSRSSGCRIRVYGSDPQQVHSLAPEIESGAKRGVPKWQWLRSDAMFFPYLLFTAPLLAYATYPWTIHTGPHIEQSAATVDTRRRRARFIGGRWPCLRHPPAVPRLRGDTARQRGEGFAGAVANAHPRGRRRRFLDGQPSRVRPTERLHGLSQVLGATSCAASTVDTDGAPGRHPR